MKSGGWSFLDFTVHEISNGFVMCLENRGQPTTTGSSSIPLSLVAELRKQWFFEAWIEFAFTFEEVLTL